MNICVLTVGLVFNLWMMLRLLGGVGNPVAVTDGSKLFLRAVSNEGMTRLLKLLRPIDIFVELDPTDIERVAAIDIEIAWFGSHKTFGTWLTLQLRSDTETEILARLRELGPRMPGRSWLFNYERPGQFLFRWSSSFTLTAHQWLRWVAQEGDFVDVEPKKITIDLTTFAVMSDEQQRSAVRRLTVLGYGPSALVMVKNAKQLSIEESARFVRSAVEGMDQR